MKYNFIVIEGNIGAGKTSLVTRIAEQYNAKLILERFEENPFLPKFYQDPTRYAFPVELSFLAERYNQLKNTVFTGDLFKTFTIADYFFMKSLIFAKNTLPDDEYDLYKQIFQIIYQLLPKPDIYIYLHVSVERLLENIRKRGRNYEQKITSGYLENIQNGYFGFFKQHPEIRFLVIDTNYVDFVNNMDDLRKITECIMEGEYGLGINRVIL